MICSPDVRQVWPESFDRAAALERYVRRLQEAKAAGVDTILDVTTIDFGRDAAFVEQAARAADLPVAVSTGLWNVSIFLQYRDQDAAEAFFVKEITSDIQ